MTEFFLASTVFYLLIFSAISRAEIGVTDHEIKISVINVQSGPLAASGTALTNGTKLFFDHINAANGVEGRRIEAIYHDDAYEPAKTAALTKEAIEKDRVFALLNFNGAPTSKAAVPVAMRAKIPMLFPRNMDFSFREHVLPYLFSLRAGFVEEFDGVIFEAVKKRGIKKIALIMQDDAFGSSSKTFALAALNKYGIPRFSFEASVARNSVNIDAVFAGLQAAQPEAVVLGLGSGSALPLLIKATEKKANWLFLASDTINGTLATLKKINAKILIGQALPNPETSELAIAKEFRERTLKAGKSDWASDYVVFEGYLGAAVFTEAVKRTGHEPSRDGLIKALETNPFDIGGFNVSWTPSNHNGTPQTYLTTIQDGRLVDMK